MHNQLNSRSVRTPKRWTVTVFAEDAAPTILTDVSNYDARLAILNLMYREDSPAEQSNRAA